MKTVMVEQVEFEVGDVIRWTEYEGDYLIAKIDDKSCCFAWTQYDDTKCGRNFKVSTESIDKLRQLYRTGTIKFVTNILKYTDTNFFKYVNE